MREIRDGVLLKECGDTALVSVVTFFLLGILVGQVMWVEPAFITPSLRGTYSELVPSVQVPGVLNSDALDQRQVPASGEKPKTQPPKSKDEEPDLNRPVPYRRALYTLPA